MTLEQVKSDIESGKCQKIYYSARGCWWTHLDGDLAASMKGYYGSDDLGTLPVDPSGGVLFQTDNPADFIQCAEDNSGHYGSGGLSTLMKAHHQNCNGQVYSSWFRYEITPPPLSSLFL